MKNDARVMKICRTIRSYGSMLADRARPNNKDPINPGNTHKPSQPIPPTIRPSASAANATGSGQC